MNKNKKVVYYNNVYEQKFEAFRNLISANKLYLGRQEDNPHNIIYDLYKYNKITEENFLRLSNALNRYDYLVLAELARNTDTRIQFYTNERKGNEKDKEDTCFSSFLDLE